MATVLCVILYVLALSCSVIARPATFLQYFRVAWSDSHIRQMEEGKAIQLLLDQTSGNICTMFINRSTLLTRLI